MDNSRYRDLGFGDYERQKALESGGYTGSKERAEQWTEEEENNFVKFLRKALAAEAAIKLGMVGGAPITGGALTGATGYGYAKTLKSMEPKYIAQMDKEGAVKKEQDRYEARRQKVEDEKQRVRDRIDAARGDKGKTDSSTPTTATAAEGSDDEYVTFTLPRANDPEYGGFAQKILDLGIATDKGLWGADGDVAFYTKQLYDQGALDANGNLKIGVPIRLRKRK